MEASSIRTTLKHTYRLRAKKVAPNGSGSRHRRSSLASPPAEADTSLQESEGLDELLAGAPPRPCRLDRPRLTTLIDRGRKHACRVAT
jgi:hypothetical protein